jgi:hypothetical protein
MNITFAQYNTDIDGSNSTVNATIDGIEMCVPISLANRHYAEIMRRVDAGELTIADAD